MSTSDLVFDPSVYVRAPMFSLPEGLTLARALIASCPRALAATLKKPSERLQTRIDAAQTALMDRQRQNTPTEEDTRLLDGEIDGCFIGLKLRLDGYAALPSSKQPKSQRASTLLRQLFGDSGLSFLRDNYPAQLAAMRILIKRIDEDKLAREIDELCGPEFLDHIRMLLPRYERMVHGVLNRETGVGENLNAHRMGLQKAISSYASAVCGTVDDSDESTIELAIQALAPLDNLRANLTGRRSTDDPQPSPAAPAAPLPPSS